MTTRERREARAERLQEWADKRDGKSEAAYEQAHAIGSMIPFGQPILVGHHSEGRHRRDIDRIDNAMRRSVENADKAADMRSRANGIAGQLEASIYDDDPDAVEQLTERVAELEAERDRIKRYNASCRKGTADPSILDDRQRARYVERSGGDPLPSYVLSNLGGNIKRNRDRLAGLKVKQQRAAKAEAVEGGVLVEVRGSGIGRYALVTFAEKPDRSVLDALKAAGFRWGKGSWVGPADQVPAEVASTVGFIVTAAGLVVLGRPPLEGASARPGSNTDGASMPSTGVCGAYAGGL